MKKLILLIAVASAVTLSSCKKDRVCTCTSSITTPGQPASAPMVDKTTYLDVSDKNATTRCIGTISERDFNGVKSTYTRKCELE